MGVLDALKENFTAYEAANYLRKRLNERVDLDDVLSLAYEKKIKLFYSLEEQKALLLPNSEKWRNIYNDFSKDFPEEENIDHYDDDYLMRGIFEVPTSQLFMSGFRSYIQGAIKSYHVKIPFFKDMTGRLLMPIKKAERGAYYSKDELLQLSFELDRVVFKKEDLDQIASQVISSSPEESTTQKNFSNRERETFLKIILGMAIKGYAYKPFAARNSAVTDIANDLEQLGIAVSDDTIRSKLEEAKELLPPEAAEMLKS